MFLCPGVGNIRVLMYPTRLTRCSTSDLLRPLMVISVISLLNATDCKHVRNQFYSLICQQCTELNFTTANRLQQRACLATDTCTRLKGCNNQCVVVFTIPVSISLIAWKSSFSLQSLRQRITRSLSVFPRRMLSPARYPLKYWDKCCFPPVREPSKVPYLEY